MNINKKIKIYIYKGDCSYPSVLGSVIAVHIAICASIYRFSSNGPIKKVEVVDPKSGPIDVFFVT